MKIMLYVCTVATMIDDDACVTAFNKLLHYYLRINLIKFYWLVFFHFVIFFRTLILATNGLGLN